MAGNTTSPTPNITASFSSHAETIASRTPSSPALEPSTQWGTVSNGHTGTISKQTSTPHSHVSAHHVALEPSTQWGTVSNGHTGTISKQTSTPHSHVSAHHVATRHDNAARSLNDSGSTGVGNKGLPVGYSSTTKGYYYRNDTGYHMDPDREFQLTLEECSKPQSISLYGKKGKISGLFGHYLNTTTEAMLCHWKIHIPDGSPYLHVLLTMPEDPCGCRYHITTKTAKAYASGKLPAKEAYRTSCRVLYKQIFVKTKVYHFMLMDDRKHMAKTNPNFTVEFDTYNEDVRKHLLATPVTPTSGYIRQFGYDGVKNHFCIHDAELKLIVPKRYVVMVSFPRFDMSEFSDCPDNGLWLYSLGYKVGTNGTLLLSRYCGMDVIPAWVYGYSLLFHFRTRTQCNTARTGFKSFYSYILIRDKPQMDSSFLYNCSTPKYYLFRQHVDCNMEFECQGSEDEGGHCPFSSFWCNGLVHSGHKCYQHLFWDHHISSYAAQRECARRNGDLAMVKSPSEWNDIKKLYQYGKRFKAALFGVRTGDSSLPDLYKYMLKWMDNSVAHNVHVLTQTALWASYHYNHERCGVLQYDQKFEVSFVVCHQETYTDFLCQVVVRQAPISSVIFPVITFPSTVVNRTKQWLLQCEDGHVTHAFLSCEAQSHCQIKQKDIQQCILPVYDGILPVYDGILPVYDGDGDSFAISMFMCDDQVTTVPYTLVCEFREDCPDSSDENFCVHNTTCEGFQCHNGQCIDREKHCNWQADCLDRSDEHMCEDEVSPYSKLIEIPQVVRLPPPVMIDFRKSGHFTQVPLPRSAACLDTHFRCEDHYCLPVYVRCNGVKDCPGGEDERRCHLQDCVGFYRCRSSRVCVHADHLCDDSAQCPQHDDEWLCNMTCPGGCLCQGHAFRCSMSVSLSPFPNVRYLDATASGMKPHQVAGLAYLVWLSLSTCSIFQISEMDLPNLRTLDLSQNRLQSLHVGLFLSLPNVKKLSLSRNLLSSLFLSDVLVEVPELQFLDLSRNLLRNFNIRQMSVFPEIQHLNISHNRMETFQPEQLSRTLSLRRIDLRGNPLTFQPQSVLTSQTQLRFIWTDDYRLCCQQNLPSQFYAQGQCISPQIHLSSCQDLFHYGEHRVVLLIVMLLSIAGNVGCLLLKCYAKRNSKLSPTDVLVIHWQLMDLAMGVYVSIMVVADWSYRHRYFFTRHVWTASVTCKLASLIASVSYQATAFLTCCVTLHGLCIACPRRGSRHQITLRSSLLLSALIWILSVTISAVPLLLPDWRYHGHRDTCLAVLTSFSHGPEQTYTLTLQVVLQVMLCLLAGAGQALLHWWYYFHDMVDLSITQRFHRMAEATSTSSRVLLDCGRRLVFCVISVLVHGGVSLPEHVRVAFPVLVLPVSAALDPVLHVVSLLRVRTRHRTLQRVLQRLQRQLVTHKPV